MLQNINKLEQFYQRILFYIFLFIYLYIYKCVVMNENFHRAVC